LKSGKAAGEKGLAFRGRRFLIRGERDLLRFSSASAPLLSDKVCRTVGQKITFAQIAFLFKSEKIHLLKKGVSSLPNRKAIQGEAFPPKI
jgi:hypothetical protein